MAPRSSTLAWKIPWTEEPGQHWRRKWQPIPVFLPGESQGHFIYLFSFLAVLCGMWDATTQTRDRTRCPCIESGKPRSLGHQGRPCTLILHESMPVLVEHVSL